MVKTTSPAGQNPRANLILLLLLPLPLLLLLLALLLLQLLALLLLRLLLLLLPLSLLRPTGGPTPRESSRSCSGPARSGQCELRQEAVQDDAMEPP